MDRKEAIEIIKIERECVERNTSNECDRDCTNCDLLRADEEIFSAYDMAIEALQEPQVGGWIPVTYHTPKDKDEDMLYAYILDCPMPEERQEILVSFNGMVDMDVCCYDEGWYLDNRGDWMDVDAWMPLPEPYKVEERGKDEE